MGCHTRFLLLRGPFNGQLSLLVSSGLGGIGCQAHFLQVRPFRFPPTNLSHFQTAVLSRPLCQEIVFRGIEASFKTGQEKNPRGKKLLSRKECPEWLCVVTTLVVSMTP